MHVYRVAHKKLTCEGLPSGPYVIYGLTPEVRSQLRQMEGAHNWCPRHPSPTSDPALGDIYPWQRCGFDSREMLHEWFQGFTKDLSDAGFAIYTYEVPDEVVKVGKFGQALFDQRQVTLVDVTDFDTNLIEV